MNDSLRVSITVQALLLSLVPMTALAQPGITPQPGVEVRDYSGWPNSLFLDSGDVQAVITPLAGGRLMRYALNYNNIIFENPDTIGRILTDENDEWSYGGYQVGLGPELRSIPKHDHLWRGEYTWTIPGPNAAQVVSKPDTATGVQITKDFLMDPGNGDLGIVQTLKNISDEEISYTVRDRTLCLNGGFAIVPLNNNSRFEDGWAKQVDSPDGTRNYTDAVDKPEQLEIMRDHAIIRCDGPATRIGLDSTEGWVAYVRGRMLLVKYFPYNPTGNYPDAGCSVKIYFDGKVAELEPSSPLTALKPGEEYAFPEQWVLIELDRMVNTHRDARRILNRIPPSPFQR